MEKDIPLEQKLFSRLESLLSHRQWLILVSHQRLIGGDVLEEGGRF